MSDLSQARTELVDAIEAAGMEAVDYVPTEVHPPLVIVGCGDPYLIPDDSFGADMVCAVELFVVFEAAEGQEFTDAAHGAILAVLAAVPGRWVLDRDRGVSAPFRASNVGGRPAVRIKISTVIATES